MLVSELQETSRTWQTKYLIARQSKDKIEHAEHSISMHHEILGNELIAELPMKEAKNIMKIDFCAWSPLPKDEFKELKDGPLLEWMKNYKKEIEYHIEQCNRIIQGTEQELGPLIEVGVQFLYKSSAQIADKKTRRNSKIK